MKDASPLLSTEQMDEMVLSQVFQQQAAGEQSGKHPEAAGSADRDR